MLSINDKLQFLSYKLYISPNSTEDLNIKKLLSNLNARLRIHFKSNIIQIKEFGSYKRDTILPRRYDKNSDVDIMIIFNHKELDLKPETYRNHLKTFTHKYYPNSIITKDHPSVVLELYSIQFDLVPTVLTNSLFLGQKQYYIPDKDNDWLKTDPDGFTQHLTIINKRYNSIVKRIIRLLKYWNSMSDYPYESFQLEQIIADMNFSGDNLEKGFFYAIKELPTWNLSQYGMQKVETLNNNADWIKEYLNRNNWDKALEYLNKIVPF